MRETDPNKFIAFLAIIATPFALGAFLLAFGPAAQYVTEDPAGDGYVPPRSIAQLVDRTQESTVTVWCDPAPSKGAQGTAWAIDLETTKSKEYPTTLITNHHVIEDCIGVEGSVWIALPYEDQVEAVIIHHGLAIGSWHLEVLTALKAQFPLATCLTQASTRSI